MKLKDRLRAPVGGFYFDDDVMNRRISGGTFRELFKRVEAFRLANGHDILDTLEIEIEDQICMRQPKDRCWYSKGIGDRISQVIHIAAGLIDKVSGTNLEQKARGCHRCGKRRVALNA